MKKYILISLILASCCIAASARELTKGYRGFFELTGEMRLEPDSYYDEHSNNGIKIVHSNCGFSTSHGYQFNPHLFIGAGISFQVYIDKLPLAFHYPVFVQLRTDWTLGKVPLYADLRVGKSISNIAEYDIVFIIPTIGYRLDWERRVAMNFGIGAAVHAYDEYSYSNNKRQTIWRALPTVRIGIEF